MVSFQNNIEELQTFDLERRAGQGSGVDGYVAPATPTAIALDTPTAYDYSPPAYSLDISSIQGPVLEDTADKTDPDHSIGNPPPSYQLVMENKDVYKVYSKE